MMIPYNIKDPPIASQKNDDKRNIQPFDGFLPVLLSISLSNL